MGPNEHDHRHAMEPERLVASNDAAERLARQGLEVTEEVEDDRTHKYVVSGNTFPFNGLLLKVGAVWDPTIEAWRVGSGEELAALGDGMEATTAGRAGNGLHEGVATYEGAPLDPLLQRFLEVGSGSLNHEELLEMILSFGSYPRQAASLSIRLLSMFGGLGATLAADVSQLKAVRYLDERSIVLLKAVHVAVQRVLHEPIKNNPVIGSWTALLDYLRVTLAHEPVEQLRVLFLDRKNILIRDEVQQRGTVDHTPLYPREIVKRALELHASAIIMVHNHPSGDPTPSRTDIEMTRQVVQALRAVGITVHDHVIVGKNRHSSFKSERLI